MKFYQQIDDIYAKSKYLLREPGEESEEIDYVEPKPGLGEPVGVSEPSISAPIVIVW